MPGSLMKFRYSAFGAACLLAACAPSVPDSNPGVGFSNYDQFRSEQARRDALLQAQRPPPAPTDAVIGEETLAVLAATRSAAGPENVSGTANVAPLPGNPAPVAGASGSVPVVTATTIKATDNPTISDEQNFDAVAGRETIESDAERIQQQRQTRQVVTPVPVPERTNSGRPNVVSYALSTQNRVGEPLYRRTGLLTSSSRYQRNCAQFASADQAQEEFLAQGGPERDRKGLDPDGDGFACFWDPSPFRAARGG